MKKLIITAIIFIIVGGLVLGVGYFTNDEIKDIVNTNIRDNKPNTEKSLNQAYDNIDIDLDNTLLEIFINETDDTRFEFYEDKNHSYKFEVSNNTLNIKQINKQFLIQIGFGTFNAKLYLAKTFKGDLKISVESGKVEFINSQKVTNYIEKLNIKLSSGKVEVSNLVVSDVNVKIYSGKLILDSLEASELDVFLSSGSVNLNGVDVINETTINVDSGDVKIKDFSSSQVDIKVSSGNANINNAIITNNIKCRISSGLIKLDNVSATNYNFDVSSGKIELDIRDTDIVNPTYKCQLSSGNLYINDSKTNDLINNTSSLVEISITISSGTVKLFFNTTVK